MWKGKLDDQVQVWELFNGRSRVSCISVDLARRDWRSCVATRGIGLSLACCHLPHYPLDEVIYSRNATFVKDGKEWDRLSALRIFKATWVHIHCLLEVS